VLRASRSATYGEQEILPVDIRLSTRFAAELANLAPIRQFVEEAATSAGADREAVTGLIQAVDEAATNVIVHGYRGSLGEIELELVREKDALLVRLRDQAPPFDPTVIPAPDLTLPPHKRKVGGLGVHLMRQCVQDMSYRLTPVGENELTLQISLP
jgi:serine/threonine-protein kinase RsbW